KLPGEFIEVPRVLHLDVVAAHLRSRRHRKDASRNFSEDFLGALRVKERAASDEPPLLATQIDTRPPAPPWAAARIRCTEALAEHAEYDCLHCLSIFINLYPEEEAERFPLENWGF